MYYFVHLNQTQVHQIFFHIKAPGLCCTFPSFHRSGLISIIDPPLFSIIDHKMFVAFVSYLTSKQLPGIISSHE